MSTDEFPDPVLSRDNVMAELRSLGVKDRLLFREDATDDKLLALLKGLRRLQLMYGSFTVHN